MFREQLRPAVGCFIFVEGMVATRAVARSISRQVKEWLHQGPSAVRALAVFEHACDLIADSGDVIALVAPQIGDGPLNIVLDGTDGLLARVKADVEVVCEPGRLWLEGGDAGHRGDTDYGVEIDLREATVWDPCPDWATLRAQGATISSSLAFLDGLCLRHGAISVLSPLLGARPTADGFARMALERAQRAAEDLRAGWRGDVERLQRGGAGLAGLGNGLTPAGDDFLAGMMLWAWLAHPTPQLFCRALMQAALSHTTALSAAFLRAAAGGQCSAAWHRLLAALQEGVEDTVLAAMQDILGRGATSGADALIGFLYLPHQNAAAEAPSP